MKIMNNDQTGRKYRGQYRDKTILIVGSGSDLDGRGMQEIIDSDRYDIVARVNKMYGAPQDVGTRANVLFTRWN